MAGGAFDVLPRRIQAEHNPLTSGVNQNIRTNPEDMANIAAQFLQSVEKIITDAVVGIIKDITGIDLSQLINDNFINDLLTGNFFNLFADAIDLLGGGRLFQNLFAMFPGIDLLAPVFDAAGAFINFISGGLLPTNLLAPLINLLIPGINIPGLDASKIISGQFPIEMITGLLDMFAGLTSGIPILGQFVGAITGVADGSLGDLSTFFDGFASGIPIVSQFIGLFTGSASGLSGMGGLGSIFGDLLGVLGSPLDLGSGSPILGIADSIPLFGPLLNTFMGFFGGNATGGLLGFSGLGSIFGDLLGVLGNPLELGSGAPLLALAGDIPLFGPLLNTFMGFFGGNATSGLLGFDGLGSIFTDLLGVLGNPLELGSGAPLLALAGDIPLFGPLIQEFIGFFVGGGSGMSGIGGLGSIFTDFLGLFGNPLGLGTGSPVLGALSSIPFFGPLFSTGTTLLGSIIPGMDASKIISGQFPMSMITGLLGVGGTILDTLIPGLDASHIISGLFPSNLFSNVPVGTLTNTNPNLLPLGAFPAGSIQGNPRWSIDNTVTATADSTGAAKVTAYGTDIGLHSIPLPVSAGQVYSLSAKTKWSGLVSTGSPLQLQVIEYTGSAETNRVLIASISSPGATGGFSSLSGSYTVPAGVTQIRVLLWVTSSANSGTVWFDDTVAQLPAVSNPIQQSWVDNLVPQFQGIADALGLGGIADLILPDIDALWTNVISSVINPLGMLANLVSGFIPGGLIPGFDASKIISGLLSMDRVNNLTGFFELFAGGGGTLGAAENMITNLLSVFNIGGISTLTGAISAFNPAPILTDWIDTLIHPLGLLTRQDDFQTMVDTVVSAATGFATTGNLVSQVETALQNFLPTNILGVSGPATIQAELQHFWNLLGGGLTQTANAVGQSPATVASAANGLAGSVAGHADTLAAHSDDIAALWTAVNGLGGSGSPSGGSGSGAFPQTTQYSSPGSFNYSIPTGCTRVDAYVLGGGAGGMGGGFFAPGSGGGAGVWATGSVTITSQTSISVTVGSGGSAGPFATTGGSGSSSQASCSGLNAVGSGGTANTGGPMPGASPGDSFGGFGGSTQNVAGGPGSPPGGGGAGGPANGSGGAGAAGTVILIAN